MLCSSSDCLTCLFDSVYTCNNHYLWPYTENECFMRSVILSAALISVVDFSS